MYDVIIIGAGVSGTALAYTLSNYTDIKKILLIEKHDKPGQVASHNTQNSQTLHYGDIETNYSFEKAKSVSQGARLVQAYLDKNDANKKIHSKYHKMVLAVGADEVAELEARYEKFKSLFPEAKLIYEKELTKLEPKVMEGRDPQEKVAALFSPNGYTVDYSRLAADMLGKAKVDVKMGEEVESIHQGKNFTVKTDKGEYKAKILISDAGAMSIRFAQMLGYADHLSIFSVAGNFYRAPKLLNGKVYRMQLAKLPFAAAHGDPDVHDPSSTRFGPTAKVLLMLERYNYKTVKDYFKSFKFTLDGMKSVAKIGFDKTYFFYMTKNMLYEVPYFGKRLFLPSIQTIVPTIKAADIKKDKGYGGARPQIINTKTQSVSLGEARVEGKKAIFNITPSPGASTCLANAQRDAKQICEWLQADFDEKKFLKEHRLQ